MKLSAVRIWIVVLLVAVLCDRVDSPVRAQQGACATQIGPKKPDLIVDQELLRSQMFLATEKVRAGSCTMMEGCVDSPGKHLVLRFNGSTANIGQADLVIGNPTSCGTLLHYDACHQHYHFSQFTDYRVWTLDGYNEWVAHRDLTIPANTGINDRLITTARSQGRLITKRKQGFCLADDGQYLPSAGPAAYRNCETSEGLSIGWEVQYPPQIPCQFIQIDRLVAGTYVLEMHVNPDLVLSESDYTNNTGAVKFQFTPKHGSRKPEIKVIP
jgi:lysyl oxidase